MEGWGARGLSKDAGDGYELHGAEIFLKFVPGVLYFSVQAEREEGEGETVGDAVVSNALYQAAMLRTGRPPPGRGCLHGALTWSQGAQGRAMGCILRR